MFGWRCGKGFAWLLLLLLFLLLLLSGMIRFLGGKEEGNFIALCFCDLIRLFSGVKELICTEYLCTQYVFDGKLMQGTTHAARRVTRLHMFSLFNHII